jgi:glyoxylase-like metal-dependent hydrolase (beta-lactamase superfamily II)
MYFVETPATEGLGNRSCLAGGRETAVVVDPTRDIDRVLAAAARRGVRVTHVAETHVHNDYVGGSLLIGPADTEGPAPVDLTAPRVADAAQLAAPAGRAGSLAGPDWAVIGPFTGAAVLGAWDGKRLTARFSGAALQRAFALVLLAVAGPMFLDAVL